MVFHSSIAWYFIRPLTTHHCVYVVGDADFNDEDIATVGGLLKLFLVCVHMHVRACACVYVHMCVHALGMS